MMVTKKKRGRPPKGSKAMTVAERKRRSRADQAVFGKPEKKSQGERAAEARAPAVAAAKTIAAPSGRRVAPPGSLLKGMGKKLMEGL